MYLHRTIEPTIKNITETFPVLLITGPRQVGKTTVLQHMAEEGRTYVTLDDPIAREMAIENPGLFFQRYKPPVLVDEIQYAPNLFTYIKLEVDKNKKNGQFWITGSQLFRMMKNVSESLAGRVGIVNLFGLSQSELDGIEDSRKFTVDAAYFGERLNKRMAYTLSEAYERIFKGSMPAVHLQKGMRRETFYSSYLQTYIERDVREIIQIGNEMEFLRFMGVVAARTGQELVYEDMTKDLDISAVTVKQWMSVLQASGIIYLMQPYFSNINKRIIKRPKLYFTDTGLCAYLTKWMSFGTLESGAMAGAIFETYVVTEILKSYYHNGSEPSICYYRDKDKKEIDVLIFYDDKVVPIGIKKSSKPDKNLARHFKVLEKTPYKIESGGIICLCNDYYPMDEKNWYIPVSVI